MVVSSLEFHTRPRDLLVDAVLLAHSSTAQSTRRWPGSAPERRRTWSKWSRTPSPTSRATSEAPPPGAHQSHHERAQAAGRRGRVRVGRRPSEAPPRSPRAATATASWGRRREYATPFFTTRASGCWPRRRDREAYRRSARREDRLAARRRAQRELHPSRYPSDARGRSTIALARR